MYGDDHALVHSISTYELKASDIRLVDDSLFTRPNVLGIFSTPSTFTSATRNILTPSRTSQSSSPNQKAKEDPIYICFPSSRKMLRWRALLRTFAKPEVYGPLNLSKKGGTHRYYRQIDMSLLEAKVYAERTSPERNRRVSGVASPPPDGFDEDKSNVGTTSLADHSRANLSSVMEHTSSQEGEKRDIGTPEGSVSSMSEDASHTHSPHISGPISGTGAFRATDTSMYNTSMDSDRRGSESMSAIPAQPSSCFCQIWRSGELVARTKVSSGTSSIAWFDKFALRDLPQLAVVHIEVLQATRNGKGFFTLGLVNVPVETMRRGEDIEGWFPIWSQPKSDETWSRFYESTSSYSQEIVGELKMSLHIREEAILAAKKYAEVAATLNGPECVRLMHRLCKELNEDRVISHLVDVFAIGGTISDRLADLTMAESSTFAAEPALLFRGNSLLSRALDKYQRRYCIDWLDSCVGATVRQVCKERIHLEAGDPVVRGVLTSHTSTQSNAGASSNVEILKQLSNELWAAIYANRHKCPVELRNALYTIRTTVNMHFDSSTLPGVQGVGAFVFLRLICPAITSPNLYGLMGTTPETGCAKTLMLLAKVFLALANKRTSFNKDKEPWLIKLNDFLERHATAYDDFITTVSTPPDFTPGLEYLGDENDVAFQSLIRDRIARLPTLHRESIPPNGFASDHSLSLASLVSYVVRGASVDEYLDSQRASTHSHGQDADVEEEDNVNDFIEMCCDIEDVAGYYIDRAGFNPEPIDLSTFGASNTAIVKTTNIFTASKAPGSDPTIADVTSSYSDAGDEYESVAVPSIPKSQSSPGSSSMRSRSATVSAALMRQTEEKSISSTVPLPPGTSRDGTPPGHIPNSSSYDQRRRSADFGRRGGDFDGSVRVAVANETDDEPRPKRGWWRRKR